MISIVPSILASSGVTMPAVRCHLNRREFRGVLAVVDEPSDRPPSGARGHRVTLTSAAVEQALPSLIGMGLNYAPSLTCHDARCKVGVITAACVVRIGAAASLEISGYLYAKDFPEVVEEIRSSGESLGLSYEIADAHIQEMRSSIWRIDELVFTGAAILKKCKAAYRQTAIVLTDEQ